MLDMSEMLQSSHLSGANASYLEAQYEAFQNDPHSVPEAWQKLFRDLQAEESAFHDHSAIKEAILRAVQQPRSSALVATSSSNEWQLSAWLDKIRRDGHRSAQCDPLALQPVESTDGLRPQCFGLDDKAVVSAGDAVSGKQPMATGALFECLTKQYCGPVGVEFSHVEDPSEREWLYQSHEELCVRKPTADQQIQLWQWLLAAGQLEKILGEKFPGQKRFSLEGGDVLVAMLRHLTQLASRQGVDHIDIGMAHRGRLNVLINVLGKKPKQLFSEFEGKHGDDATSGDVKYHLGYSNDVMVDDQSVHLSLACNPSHLEIISPVLLGTSRARQVSRSASERSSVLPVVLHGDAAFAGQGIVMETFALANTRAYGVGGAIHIAINNQVGFTTSDHRDSRSSRYCSDAAKAIAAPVMHVNGDDPEAVLNCIELALAYRQKYQRDFVIDLVCYRRHGHQEVDEPTGTQPRMYQVIKAKRKLYDAYAEQLIADGVLSSDQVKQHTQDYRKQVLAGDSLLRTKDTNRVNNWAPYLGQQWTAECDTKVAQEDLKLLAKELTKLPESFVLQKQVANMFKQRQAMLSTDEPIDWGFAETLAYASLLAEGRSIRMTGQDVRRGTFYHRHAALHDANTGAVHMPLRQCAQHDAQLNIYDSILSEAAVLGFEYGYASQRPDDLTIWEAQFGDFANGAQVVIDQFISSAWQKWQRLSGLVMLLPHGYEGQGPEHSSARLERFLQLAAQNNIQVCVPSHAAQIFHLLRRQVLRPYRRPLVVMSPKSLLRLKQAKCTWDDLSQGTFQPAMVDRIGSQNIKRIVFCSGKVFYDLKAERDQQNLDHVALVRIEQLYPFPMDEVRTIVEDLGEAVSWVWCQEEPKNQGSWYFVRPYLEKMHGPDQTLVYAGRAAAAAPAVGYLSRHQLQQKELVDEALHSDDN